jgi:hypothetical protein
MNGNIQAAIFKYKEYRRSNPDTCALHCKNQNSFTEAIYFACISEDAQGKRHSHQYRLKKQDMEAFAFQLQLQEQRLRNADNFDTLFRIVNNVGSNIDGIGDMLIYDAAERIGAFLNLFPDKVYLHAGTKKGAEKVLGKIEGSTIKKEMFPEPIRSSNLSCADIESMLCMYKNIF